MARAVSRNNILKASAELQKSLVAVGRKEHSAPGKALFKEEDSTLGVFLVAQGKVRMGVKGLAKLDRTFSSGSLLGLPSTFTGHPYSLTAIALTDLDVIHVPSDEFLRLMKEQPDLCREAMEMLGREVTFIQKALAERRRQLADKKLSYCEVPL
ncbi:MAG TPA: cyclic nucleotide-binding domain-containing protein [Terriglobales bacterium]|nr:cyclic nucleotide-binding domain-containing protein [Terriglobales bacterium]